METYTVATEFIQAYQTETLKVGFDIFFFNAYAGAETTNRAHNLPGSLSFPNPRLILKWLQSTETGLQRRANS